MLDFGKIREQFENECTACGLCIERCPIVPFTELKGADPEKIMGEILDLFRHGRVGGLARKRIYSCLYCNACLPYCPKGLSPGLCFALGKGMLQEAGDPIPKGVSSVLPFVGELMRQAILSLKQDPGASTWLVTDAKNRSAAPPRTVLFPSCFGIIEQKVIKTAVKIVQRIDPTVKVLGGLDYCCGELYLIAGETKRGEEQFGRMVEALNALSPEKVLILCPTCNMNFDLYNPKDEWSWHFLTDFITEHLRELGPLEEVNATVTVHDPCHFVRGIKPGSDSPREILRAIPGVKVIEMGNARKDTLCCAGYAITGSGGPGLEFRGRRLKEAKNTGADILTLYCPGCQMVLGPEGPKHSLKIESIITLLAKSLGIN